MYNTYSMGRGLQISAILLEYMKDGDEPAIGDYEHHLTRVIDLFEQSFYLVSIVSDAAQESQS